MSLAQQFAAQDHNVTGAMPRYRCQKDVWALKIQSVETNLPTIEELEKTLAGNDDAPGGFLKFEDPGYGVRAVSTDYMRKHKPVAGGYFVVYKDGYESFMSARRAVENELEEMKGSGRILLMSDEEERLIRSFRRFKGQLKRDGEVFKWQTRRDAFEEGRLIEAPESVLVRDPQEVSD
jgi:hypothetical protein